MTLWRTRCGHCSVILSGAKDLKLLTYMNRATSSPRQMKSHAFAAEAGRGDERPQAHVVRSGVDFDIDEVRGRNLRKSPCEIAVGEKPDGIDAFDLLSENAAVARQHTNGEQVRAAAKKERAQVQLRPAERHVRDADFPPPKLVFMNRRNRHHRIPG